MHISFSPQRSDDMLTLEKTGDVLAINGAAFDFTALAEGGTIPAKAVPCDWIVGPVERIDGEIHLTLILPHGPNPTVAVAFPEPIIVTEHGPIAVPVDLAPEPEPANVEP